MSFSLKKLYGLLPALYRIRDTELGIRMLTDEDKLKLVAITGNENYFPDEYIYGPLKSILSVIAEQVAVLEENLEQLYDDQFIETCADWVISYIGELVGTRSLISLPDAPFSQRGEVANTIKYRRRKGTASVIEQLARDVTGWNASVVEYFKLLSTTQYMNHLRPDNLALTSVRNRELPDVINTPFDKTSRTADVRRIENKRGRYNIQNIGIFLWRLNSYSMTESPAYRVDDRRFIFNSLGLSKPLYNLPETEDEITHLAEPVNVPMPISRLALENSPDTYYGIDKSILIYKNGNLVLPEESNLPSDPPSALYSKISVCDLSDLCNSDGIITGWANLPENNIAIDPVLGRIAFPASDPPPESVHVSYYYGFSVEMSGGEYSRESTFTSGPDIIKVNSAGGTIQNALDQLASTGGIVEIQDNEYYFETPVIKVAKGKTIELRSADNCRPVLVLADEMLIEGEENSTVIINGLLVCGSRLHLPLKNLNNDLNQLQLLQILHCTFLPCASPQIGEVEAQIVQPRLVIETPETKTELDKCITGALRVSEESKVKISNCIVDALCETEVAYAGLSGEDAGGSLQVENSTIIGKVHTVKMELFSNTIFLAGILKSDSWIAPVIVQRLQQGCVRFSYFPSGSKLPRPYRCQPTSPSDEPRLRPVFTSLTYGDPGYCQLSAKCAAEITSGADDEAEMGAFHNLYQPQRERNLRTRLDEYLRFGLEAGIFYV